MADTEQKTTKKTSKKQDASDETKKRKQPAKDEGSGEIRRSSRIRQQQKSTYREADSDEEDYDPKPKKASPKKRAAAKKKKADDDDSDDSPKKDNGSDKKEEAKDAKADSLPPPSLGMSSDSTQPMSLSAFQLPSQPSQSQSQDGLGLLNKAYGEVQSLEASIQTYEHSKSYFQPLGKISKQQLHDAEKVLTDVQKILQDEATQKEADANYNRPDDVKKKLKMLTDHFYNLIPSQDQSTLPSINNEVILKEKFALLKALEGTHVK